MTYLRHHPHRRLRIILDVHQQGSERPFRVLDAFNASIFSSVEDVDFILRVIAANILFSFPLEDTIELKLGLELRDMSRLLSELTSMMEISSVSGSMGLTETGSGQPRCLRRLHATLTDCLSDPIRYFIDLKTHANHLALTRFNIIRCQYIIGLP